MNEAIHEPVLISRLLGRRVRVIRSNKDGKGDIQQSDTRFGYLIHTYQQRRVRQFDLRACCRGDAVATHVDCVHFEDLQRIRCEEGQILGRHSIGWSTYVAWADRNWMKGKPFREPDDCIASYTSTLSHRHRHRFTSTKKS